MSEKCKCGHNLHRHDMGHGCIECRCRHFREEACTEHEWMEFGGPGDEWRECFLCGQVEDA